VRLCALTGLLGCGASVGGGGGGGGGGATFGALGGTWDVTFSSGLTAVASVGTAGATSATFTFAERTSSWDFPSGTCAMRSSLRLAFEFTGDLATGTMSVSEAQTNTGPGCVDIGGEGTRNDSPQVYQLRHPSRGSTLFGMGGGQWEVVDPRGRVVLNISVNQNSFVASTPESRPYSAMGTLADPSFVGTDSRSGTFTARRR
jgi:hypothetical protein